MKGGRFIVKSLLNLLNSKALNKLRFWMDHPEPLQVFAIYLIAIFLTTMCSEIKDTFSLSLADICSQFIKRIPYVFLQTVLLTAASLAFTILTALCTVCGHDIKEKQRTKVTTYFTKVNPSCEITETGLPSHSLKETNNEMAQHPKGNNKILKWL